MAKPKRICSVDGCDKGGRIVRGMCLTHYARWKKHGHTNLVVRKTTADWIKSHVHHKGDECLLWPFAVGKGGYGNLNFGGKFMNAHRVMALLAHGDAPSQSHEVAHSCHNPGCVNPQHLRWATKSENNLEKADNGTQRRGETTPNSVLTEGAVRAIRRDWPHLSCDELAEKYGCNRNAAWKAATGRTWAHVD